MLHGRDFTAHPIISRISEPQHLGNDGLVCSLGISKTFWHSGQLTSIDLFISSFKGDVCHGYPLGPLERDGGLAGAQYDIQGLKLDS
jgi:hypothetical protein